MNVWIVGNGARIDSVWDTSGAAHARANALNDGPGTALAFSVCGPFEVRQTG